jgi:hypothetical protein
MMTTPREEYLNRRVSAGLLYLTKTHHHVMDRIFFEFSDGFSFDDVFQRAVTDSDVVDDVSEARSTNPIDIERVDMNRVINIRVKLVVIRSLDALVGVGMLREATSDAKRYYFCWTPTQ